MEILRITCLALLTGLTTAPRPAHAQVLSRSDIQRGIQAVRPDVDRCLRSAAASALVKVRLEILDGRVASIEVREAGAASSCVERAVRRARFRRSSRPITTVYPFVARVSTPVHVPSGGAGVALSRDQVASGVRSIRPAVDRCRPRNATRLLVKVRFEIAGGHVIRARGSANGADPATIACVERAVMGAAFPRAKRMAVHYPFLLH